MAKILSMADFKYMPWKNGAGSTLELFKIPHAEKADSFYFRLSVARVEKDGPFSIFPGIDRTLICLSGEGFKLNYFKSHTTLKSFDPYQFNGEQEIFCELLGGPCVDFNVMVDREWGKARVELKQLTPHQIERLCFENMTFCYLHSSSPELIVLGPGEIYEIKPSEAKTLISVGI